MNLNTVVLQTYAGLCGTTAGHNRGSGDTGVRQEALDDISRPGSASHQQDSLT
jgi:hypothetical protein